MVEVAVSKFDETEKDDIKKFDSIGRKHKINAVRGGRLKNKKVNAIWQEK